MQHVGEGMEAIGFAESNQKAKVVSFGLRKKQGSIEHGLGPRQKKEAARHRLEQRQQGVEEKELNLYVISHAGEGVSIRDCASVSARVCVSV